MRRWLMKLTGGRPMRRTGHAFRDTVSGRDVHYFVDWFGRHWMAEHRWASFRVERQSRTRTEGAQE